MSIRAQFSGLPGLHRDTVPFLIDLNEGVVNMLIMISFVTEHSGRVQPRARRVHQGPGRSWQRGRCPTMGGCSQRTSTQGGVPVALYCEYLYDYININKYYVSMMIIQISG